MLNRFSNRGFCKRDPERIGSRSSIGQRISPNGRPWALMDPAARAQGPADTELLALDLACGAGNPNPEPLHMRLKRRALHAQQSGRSLRTGDYPVGLVESGQDLFSLGVLEHAAHLSGILGRAAAVRGLRRRIARPQVL